MVITAQNIWSWPVALWLVLGVAVVVAVWRVSKLIRVAWQSTFFRAAAVALCFTPLPSPGVFALTDPIGIIPLWWVLLSAIREGALLASALVLLAWLVAAYFLWVAGMSIHHVFRRRHVS